jgi:hypothetical protein
LLRKVCAKGEPFGIPNEPKTPPHFQFVPLRSGKKRRFSKGKRTAPPFFFAPRKRGEPIRKSQGTGSIFLRKISTLTPLTVADFCRLTPPPTRGTG